MLNFVPYIVPYKALYFKNPLLVTLAPRTKLHSQDQRQRTDYVAHGTRYQEVRP